MTTLEYALAPVVHAFLAAEPNRAFLFGEIADHLNVSKATLSRSIDRLISIGVVEKWRDPVDRRLRWVRALTTEPLKRANPRTAVLIANRYKEASA